MKLPATLQRLLDANTRPVQVVSDVLSGTLRDGFIHAGNLAYVTLTTLFPIFILIALAAGAFGRTEDGVRAVDAFFRTLPDDVARLLADPIRDIVGQRASGGLITFGVIITLWTIGSYIETMREIVRRAYAAPPDRSVWRDRLASTGLIVFAIVLIIVAFSAQVLLTGATEFILGVIPFAGDIAGMLQLGQLIPALMLFGALWAILRRLTPRRHRHRTWPGALLIALAWVGTTAGLPTVLSLIGGYNNTYGSLAGVMIALLFFFIIGLAFSIGAQLNAALAKPGGNAVEPAGVAARETA